MDEDKKLKKTFLTISIVFFILSLTQKCYCTTSTCSDSIMVFLLGWFAMFSGGAGISWIANPFLLGAWIMLKKNLKISMFLSMGAVLMSLSFLLFESVLDNENNQAKEIISYKAGYLLWVSSTVVMLIGTYLLMLRYNTRKLMEKKKSATVEYLH
ncbi:MAG TPA: hypothetical protein PKD91_00360 [Bacteroidia bacterium]|nr:hypothetical protein [Bacteroidia bacterium]